MPLAGAKIRRFWSLVISEVNLLHFRPVRELDQKIFVFGIARLQERNGGVTRRGDLVLHAAADVEDDAEADRNVFRREVRDLLFELVFPDLEMIRFQSGDVSILGSVTVALTSTSSTSTLRV